MNRFINDKELPLALLQAYLDGNLSPDDRKYVEVMLRYEWNRNNLEKLKKNPVEIEFDKEKFDKLKEKIGYFKIKEKEKRTIPKAGEVWSVKNKVEVIGSDYIYHPTPLYFLIISDPEPWEGFEPFKEYYHFSAVPLTPQIDYVDHFDILIENSEHETGTEFYAQCALETELMVCHLRDFEFEIDEITLKAAKELINKANGCEYDKSILRDAVTGLKWDDPDSLNALFKQQEFDKLKPFEISMLEFYESVKEAESVNIEFDDIKNESFTYLQAASTEVESLLLQTKEKIEVKRTDDLKIEIWLIKGNLYLSILNVNREEIEIEKVLITNSDGEEILISGNCQYSEEDFIILPIEKQNLLKEDNILYVKTNKYAFFTILRF